MNRWVPALRLTGIGFYIVTCIVGGTFAGWWLGGKRPVFTIVGLVIGLAADQRGKKPARLRDVFGVFL